MRVSIEQAMEHSEHPVEQTSSNRIYSFFLSDDRDSGKVHMLQENEQDSIFFKTHTVAVTLRNGKKIFVDVDCLGQHCPLCDYAFKHKGEFPTIASYAKVKIYIPVFVLQKKTAQGIEDVKKLQVFSRSATWYKQDLVSFTSRYGDALYKKAIEIERSGLKGEKQISYRLYPAESDFNGNPLQTVTETLDELKAKLGYTDELLFGAPTSFIRKWTAEQMEEVLATGNLPSNAPTATEPPPESSRLSVNYGF